MNLGYGNVNENPEELQVLAKLLTAGSGAEVADLVRGYIESIPHDDRLTALTYMVAQMAEFLRAIQRNARDQGVDVLEGLEEKYEQMQFEKLTKGLELDEQ